MFKIGFYVVPLLFVVLIIIAAGSSTQQEGINTHRLNAEAANIQCYHLLSGTPFKWQWFASLLTNACR